MARNPQFSIPTVPFGLHLTIYLEAALYFRIFSTNDSRNIASVAATRAFLGQNMLPPDYVFPDHVDTDIEMQQFFELVNLCPSSVSVRLRI